MEAEGGVGPLSFVQHTVYSAGVCVCVVCLWSMCVCVRCVYLSLALFIPLACILLYYLFDVNGFCCFVL